MPRSPAITRARWSRPEHELLVCCARTHVDDDRAARIRALLGATIDWPHLVQIARWHGVTALLHHTLAAFDWADVPAPVRAELELTVTTAGMQNRFYATELARTLDVLRAEGIAALSLKGPTLAMTAYGRLDLRRISDLDLLVAKRDFNRAKEVLGGRGYRLDDEYDWECSFVSAAGLVWIDLHRGLSPWSFPVPVDFDRFWSRRRSITLDDVEIPCLSVEDTLLTLCLQVAKDGWAGTNRLLKICDIAELLRAVDSIDWPVVEEEAGHLRSRLMLGFGLELASRIVGYPAVAEATRRREVPPGVAALAEREAMALFEQYRETWMGRRRAARFHRVVRECWRDRLIPHLEPIVSLVWPNEHDRTLLPARLASLAVFVRPFRLLVQSLVRLAQARARPFPGRSGDRVSASRLSTR